MRKAFGPCTNLLKERWIGTLLGLFVVLFCAPQLAEAKSPPLRAKKDKKRKARRAKPPRFWRCGRLRRAIRRHNKEVKQFVKRYHKARESFQKSLQPRKFKSRFARSSAHNDPRMKALQQTFNLRAWRSFQRRWRMAARPYLKRGKQLQARKKHRKRCKKLATVSIINPDSM